MSIVGSQTGRVSRDYQDQAIDFLKTCSAFLLADPPGAGKTLMALSCVRPKAGPTLIVTNSAVTYFWEDEIHDWVDPNAKVAVYEQLNQGSADFWKQDADFFVVYWEALPYNESVRVIRKGKKANEKPKRVRPEIHMLSSRTWGTIVADEAHRLKNRNSQQSRILRSLRATYKYALTASPIVNSPGELWAVLNFLRPQDYRSYWRYFEQEVIAQKMSFGGYKVIGWKDAPKMTETLRRFTVRRKKKTILPELPDIQHTTIMVDLTPAQRKAYDDMAKKFVATLPNGKIVITPTVLAQMIRLRQFACGLHLVGGPEESSKLDSAMSWILGFLEESPEESVVVFSQFVPMVHSVVGRLTSKKVESFMITGQDVKDNAVRHEYVQQFQLGVRPVFVATTQTMGESATLTRASVALFMDRVWSPFKQEQAEGRLHRLGQKNSVQVIIYEARNTIEQKVTERLKEKGEIAGAVLDRDELIGMVGGSHA